MIPTASLRLQKYVGTNLYGYEKTMWKLQQLWVCDGNLRPPVWRALSKVDEEGDSINE